MSVSQSPELDQLATALAVAQGSIQPAIRDRTNPAFKSSYADLASTWDACRVALSSNGLAVSQHPGRLEDGSVTVTTMLLHKSGQHISSVCSALPRDASPASVGSVVTYLRRYGLAAAVGVSPEDDDGQAASQPAAPYAPAQRVPAPAQRVADALGGKVESVERLAPVLSSVDPSCPTCSGTMWDNRPKKASGDANPKSPDFKCKDKACGGCIWKYGEKPRGPVPQTRGPLLDAPAPTDEDAPGFPF
jgi:hypothetical protein